MDVVDLIRLVRFIARRYGGFDSRLVFVRIVYSNFVVTVIFYRILVEIFIDEVMVDVIGDRQIFGFVERLFSFCVAVFDLGREFVEVVVYAQLIEGFCFADVFWYFAVVVYLLCLFIGWDRGVGFFRFRGFGYLVNWFCWGFCKEKNEEN